MRHGTYRNNKQQTKQRHTYGTPRTVTRLTQNPTYANVPRHTSGTFGTYQTENVPWRVPHQSGAHPRQRTPNMAKPQYSGPWQRIRKTILQRDLHTCQIQSPNCTQHATQVDHIVPVHQGGAWYDPTNLRAACANCNNQRNQPNNRWQNHTTQITLVTGPPAAGKKEYVKKHAKDTDLVIDYDDIAQALGAKPGNNHLHDAVSTARNALLTALRQARLKVDRAWIISSNPDASRVFPHHKLVTIDPGKDKAISNAIRSSRGDHVISLIEQWYTRGTVQSTHSRDW